MFQVVVVGCCCCFFSLCSCLLCAYILLYYLPQLSESKKNAGAQKKNQHTTDRTDADSVETINIITQVEIGQYSDGLIRVYRNASTIDIVHVQNIFIGLQFISISFFY